MVVGEPASGANLLDQLEATLRALRHADRDRTIERHDGRGIDALQLSMRNM